MSSSRRVSYFYDIEVGNYHYGQGTYYDYSYERWRSEVQRVQLASVAQNFDCKACLCLLA